MVKLRSIAMAVVVGALLSGTAFAQEGGSAAQGSGSVAQASGSADGAWNTKYGMLFTVQNVFGNNNASTLSDLGGSVGLQYNLGPQSALRLTIDLSRASNVGSESTTTNLVTGIETTTFTPPVGFSSRYEVGLGVAYMMRLTSSALAPYLGAGASIGYTQQALQYTDDVTTSNPNIVDVDHMTRTTALGAEGILGLEWRVHRSLSLFAEYTLDFTVVSLSSTTNEDTSTSKATGAMTNGTKVEFSSTKFLNFNTGLGQGGLIGLVAFF